MHIQLSPLISPRVYGSYRTDFFQAFGTQQRLILIGPTQWMLSRILGRTSTPRTLYKSLLKPQAGNSNPLSKVKSVHIGCYMEETYVQSIKACIFLATEQQVFRDYFTRKKKKHPFFQYITLFGKLLFVSIVYMYHTLAFTSLCPCERHDQCLVVSLQRTRYKSCLSQLPLQNRYTSLPLCLHSFGEVSNSSSTFPSQTRHQRLNIRYLFLGIFFGQISKIAHF